MPDVVSESTYLGFFITSISSGANGYVVLASLKEFRLGRTCFVTFKCCFFFFHHWHLMFFW